MVIRAIASAARTSVQNMKSHSRYTVDELAQELVSRRTSARVRTGSLRERWGDHKFYVALGRVDDQKLGQQ